MSCLCGGTGVYRVARFTPWQIADKDGHRHGYPIMAKVCGCKSDYTCDFVGDLAGNDGAKVLDSTSLINTEREIAARSVSDNAPSHFANAQGWAL